MLKTVGDGWTPVLAQNRLDQGAAAVAHTEVAWADGCHMLVVGGEGAGISAEAVAFARQNNGAAAVIRMTAGTDSLNAGSAAAVFLFEAARQHALATANGGVATP